MKEALRALAIAFPKAGFRYDAQADCLIAVGPSGSILVGDPGRLGTEALRWEATYGEEEVLAETPVRAVRLLCKRAALNLEGV